MRGVVGADGEKIWEALNRDYGPCGVGGGEFGKYVTSQDVSESVVNETASGNTSKVDSGGGGMRVHCDGFSEGVEEEAVDSFLDHVG